MYLKRPFQALNLIFTVLNTKITFDRVAIMQPFLDDADKSFGFRSYYNISMTAGYAIHFYYSDKKHFFMNSTSAEIPCGIIFCLFRSLPTKQVRTFDADLVQYEYAISPLLFTLVTHRNIYPSGTVIGICISCPSLGARVIVCA